MMMITATITIIHDNWCYCYQFLNYDDYYDDADFYYYYYHCYYYLLSLLLFMTVVRNGNNSDIITKAIHNNIHNDNRMITENIVLVFRISEYEFVADH